MLVIDGSYGEGGGQILRTSLSLAALTGKSCRLENIRTGRPKPGLRPQHLTAVRALAHITRAQLTGDTIGSTRLTFSPLNIFPGTYTFDVAEKTGSAGSVSLIAQALVPVLLFARSPTALVIKGGTHVPWSPSAHYLIAVFLPALQEMGATVTCSIRQWGFYPRGGGQIELGIKPASRLQAVQWTRPPAPENFQGLSAAANLPDHVIQRQSRSLQSHLEWPLRIREEQAPSQGRGSLVFLFGPHAGFAALGEKGKPAEQVAAQAAQAFKKFIASQAGIDRHLADQIMLYAALATGESALSTEAVTSHLLTNIWVIEQFLEATFEVQGQLSEKGLIRVRGLGGHHVTEAETG